MDDTLATDPATIPTLHRIGFAPTEAAALAELSARTEAALRFGESLGARDAADLDRRPGPKRWSALEAVEHANRYAADYLPGLRRAGLRAGERGGAHSAYAPGWLGRRFALAVHPDRREKRLRTFPSKDPRGSALDARDVIARFVAHQRDYLAVLSALAGRSLTDTRVGVSVFPLARLPLGDMLYVVLWHNARHVAQAREALPSR